MLLGALSNWALKQQVELLNESMNEMIWIYKWIIFWTSIWNIPLHSLVDWSFTPVLRGQGFKTCWSLEFFSLLCAVVTFTFSLIHIIFKTECGTSVECKGQSRDSFVLRRKKKARFLYTCKCKRQISSHHKKRVGSHPRDLHFAQEIAVYETYKGGNSSRLDGNYCAKAIWKCKVVFRQSFPTYCKSFGFAKCLLIIL